MKKIILTKELRNTIYKEALKVYLILCSRGVQLGLCWTIQSALFNLGMLDRSTSPYNNMKKYKEVYQYKTETIDSSGFWWNRTNISIRISVLESAIKETT